MNQQENNNDQVLIPGELYKLIYDTEFFTPEDLYLRNKISITNQKIVLFLCMKRLYDKKFGTDTNRFFFLYKNKIVRISFSNPGFALDRFKII